MSDDDQLVLIELARRVAKVGNDYLDSPTESADPESPYFSPEEMRLLRELRAVFWEHLRKIQEFADRDAREDPLHATCWPPGPAPGSVEDVLNHAVMLGTRVTIAAALALFTRHYREVDRAIQDRQAMPREADRLGEHVATTGPPAISEDAIRCTGRQLEKAFNIGHDKPEVVADRAKRQGNITGFDVIGDHLRVIPKDEGERAKLDGAIRGTRQGHSRPKGPKKGPVL
jgi:hypothetical protein